MAARIDDPRLLDLLWQYLRRTAYDGGLYEDKAVGISLGCPLSPLMGELYIDPVDKLMEATGLCYVRFMDDWVILAPTRWKLRNAIRMVNQGLNELKVVQHPDKTYIGRIAHGFVFLGYEIDAPGLTGVAPPTVKRFVERAHRLYEQGALTCLGEYVRRWLRWVQSGLSGYIRDIPGRVVNALSVAGIPLHLPPPPIRQPQSTQGDH